MAFRRCLAAISGVTPVTMRWSCLHPLVLLALPLLGRAVHSTPFPRRLLLSGEVAAAEWHVGRG